MEIGLKQNLYKSSDFVSPTPHDMIFVYNSFMTDQPNIPNNEEIEKALQEFGVKSNEVQPPASQEHPISAVITPQNPQNSSREVEGVKFENESYRAIKFYKENVAPKMVSAVIKYSGGAVKGQRQAEWVLLGFAILMMGISIYLVFGGVNNNSMTKEQQAQIKKVELMEQNSKVGK